MRVRRRFTVPSLVATLAMSALVVSSCVPPGPPPRYTNANVDSFAEYVFGAKLRDTRAFTRQPGLRAHGALTDKARRWSQHMANGGCAARNICHSNLRSGISGVVASWSLIGENVGRGGSVNSLWHAFMNSHSHRANILDRRWHYYGIGVIRTGSTIWVTMVFMRM